jgi:hypothetical protein
VSYRYVRRREALSKTRITKTDVRFFAIIGFSKPDPDAVERDWEIAELPDGFYPDDEGQAALAQPRLPVKFKSHEAARKHLMNLAVE